MNEGVHDQTELDAPDPSDDFGYLRIVVVPLGEPTRAAMTEALKEFSGAHIQFSHNGAAVIRAVEAETRRPDVVFFEALDHQEAQDRIAGLQGLGERCPPAIIPLLLQPTRAATFGLIKAGAFDVMSTAPDGVEVYRVLARSISNQKSQLSAAQNDDEEPGKLIAFMHADGGAGATTLAMNAALELQKTHSEDRGVCFIDLDVQFGSAHLQLDLPMQSRLLPIVRNPRRLDSRMLDDIMIEGPNGLRVLTAPESSMPLEALEPDVVATILSLARARYRYVVVDLPVTLNRWTATVLAEAEETYIVTQLTVAAVRSTRRLLDTLKNERVETGKITVVANRVGDKTGANRISLEKVAKALDAPVDHTIPNDFALAVESVNNGAPVAVSRPTTRLARAIREMMRDRLGETEEERPAGFLGALRTLRSS